VLITHVHALTKRTPDASQTACSRGRVERADPLEKTASFASFA
jgi:hypothetical protein